jgi:hypothetical protein
MIIVSIHQHIRRLQEILKENNSIFAFGVDKVSLHATNNNTMNYFSSDFKLEF